MCNDYGNRIAYQDYVEAFSHMRLPLVFPGPEAAPNLEPRDEIWPSEAAPVIRLANGGTALSQTPWGFCPSRPGGRLAINLRSEGRAFTQGRCLVPASHYYEFTGTKSPKTRWRFSPADGNWFCFAGVLGRGPDGAEAFALLTTGAGPDVAPRHHRQPVVLEQSAWAPWLAGAPASGLLRPSPTGTLTVADAPRQRTREQRNLSPATAPNVSVSRDG